jgi:hypothetical protein
MFMLVAI